MRYKKEMELQQLRYFCAVARTGSFTRAAEQENITQPSLSEAIRKLETDVGAPLFERLGRSIKLTPQGDRLLPHALQILREVSEARQSVDLASSKTPAGRLRVGSIPTIMPYFLAPRLNRFLLAHPLVQVELLEDQTARLMERLQEGDLDLAVLALPATNPDLLCGELFREPVMLAVPEDSDLARRTSVDLAELTGQPMLLLKEGHCFRQHVQSICRRARLMLDAKFESDHLASIFPLVSSGFGVSLVPAMSAPDARGCTLIPITPEAERRVGYVRLKQKQSTASQRALIQWLRSESRVPLTT